jgi:hypothetical protein
MTVPDSGAHDLTMSNVEIRMPNEYPHVAAPVARRRSPPEVSNMQAAFHDVTEAGSSL